MLQARLNEIINNLRQPNIFKEIDLQRFTLSASASESGTCYTVIDGEQNQGSNSMVLHCVDNRGDDFILKALKVYGDNKLERFAKEVAYQQIAGTPEIIQYGLGNKLFGLPTWEFGGSDMLFILMKYKGTALSEYLQAELDAFEFAEMSNKVKDAFAKMIAKGLIKKDVELANIVIDDEGNITVIDFDPQMTYYQAPLSRQQLRDWAVANPINDDDGYNISDRINGNSSSIDIIKAMHEPFFTILDEILKPYHPHVTCDTCGNRWDGHAQCTHPHYEDDDASDSEESNSVAVAAEYHQFVSTSYYIFQRYEQLY
tara:strand:+ start:1911 stop:2852 length:942 start_codon:yes stop_codon:yes gene_type:complete